jgi:predicted ArsR family transcriptional regulator
VTATWTFFTNHAHVLLCIAQDPDIRMRDVAAKVGITERAAQRIVAELEQEGYLHHERVGRRNHYRLVPDSPLRHPLEEHVAIGQVLDLLSRESMSRP